MMEKLAGYNDVGVLACLGVTLVIVLAILFLPSYWLGKRLK